MENIKKIIPKIVGKKILVFGDLMLDEHIWSRVSRISPEAPVPIADVARISHVPGGCGNVAANIASLKAKAYLVSVIGKDSSGQKLRKALSDKGISTRHLVIDPKRPTILKSRIIAGSQHMVRVDREDRTVLSPKLLATITKRLNKLIPKMDAIIISDYAKGSVTAKTTQLIISLAKKHKKPVSIDPKGVDFSKYRGATVITPNLREASIAARRLIISEKSLIKAGQVLAKLTGSKNVLITRGRDGMSLICPDEVIYIPAVPREVFDITGAGDTVIATLTLALATGATAKNAAILANYAASVVIGKIGTAPCLFEELEEAISGHEPIAKKIKLRKELHAIVQNLRNENAKIIFTNGCFDILHLGHVRYLSKAKKLGDILIIGLNSDASVRKLKGKDRPYIYELERAEILASLECVDYVCIFEETRPDNLIKIVKPDFHVKGGDYKINRLPEKKLVESLGGKVIVIPPIKGRSTTNLVKRILSGK
ncbi:MAG: D-glycero-beta-D-manno-heptose-7-phosphate kinase [Candidatus Saganbacteria bacterium]|nr:D-glycero-beta-D-manno-heptose-7-phosphate kinase [Candidatus Saganbacteria bacterium]